MTDIDKEFADFCSQIYAAFAIIQDSLERFPPSSELAAPADWSEAQATLRKVADEFMLCADVQSTVDKLKEDKTAFLLVFVLTTEVDDEFVIETMRRAFVLTTSPSRVLPGQAFATYLLEYCNQEGPKWSTSS